MSQLNISSQPASFNTQVWEIVSKIPRGKVASYGQIAKMLPPPAGVDSETYLEFGALWVSGAVASCPDDVPGREWSTQKARSANKMARMQKDINSCLKRKVSCSV